MQLDPHQIHIWIVNLTETRKDEDRLLGFLNEAERQRADRFVAALHRQRFIAAHGALRDILGRYLNCAPEEIQFTYSEHKKPHLSALNALKLEFNLSHSDQLAVCALTLHHAIGIDIEKMKISYNPNIAKRFFNQKEYQALLALPAQEKMAGFYRLWSRKEALIKALGKGLSLPLSSFSVSVLDKSEKVKLEEKWWSLTSLAIHPEYQSALATDQEIGEVALFNY
jgi:4'-phosphopantetheinyl transferase